jgi:F0F1-type ATP synthase assembly protein I
MTTLKAVSLVAVIFVGISVGIFAAAFLGYITVQLALLLLVALLGMYLGFGILIAVYRFTSRLK